jgi:hypothetical protein
MDRPAHRDKTPAVMRLARSAAFAAALSSFAIVAACDGCRHAVGNRDTGSASAETGPPTVRLFFLSDVAGALEPCGCQKNMLGGVDHFASIVAKGRESAPAAVALVGPTWFMDPKIHAERREQDLWKAEALSKGLAAAGTTAITPGFNDWAGGEATLANLAKSCGAPVLAGNLQGATAGAVVESTREIGGVKVAFLAVSTPKDAAGNAPEGVTIQDPGPALAAAAKKARGAGARIVVGLAALERGEALRLAEAAPELDLLAVGSTFGDGEANTPPKAPRFVGPVLVLQTSNHLTRTAVVELHVRDGGRFADGSGLARAAEVTDLELQIDDLTKRLSNWERDPSVPAKDLEAQRARLASLKEKLQKAKVPPVQPTGSFLRYELTDVRESAGKHPGAAEAMASYYKRVNAFNKEKFAEKKAPPPGKGEAWFVGDEPCRACHAASFDHWKTTGHAHAYKTLEDASKEFNLDCVGCHVTGYDVPGGSTVTDVLSPNLKDVQCESCHGPGSKHIEDPSGGTLIAAPGEEVCATCHHPPHTDVFDYKARLEKVLGPGHGKPGAAAQNDPPKGWKPPKPRFKS